MNPSFLILKHSINSSILYNVTIQYLTLSLYYLKIKIKLIYWIFKSICYVINFQAYIEKIKLSQSSWLKFWRCCIRLLPRRCGAIKASLYAHKYTWFTGCPSHRGTHRAPSVSWPREPGGRREPFFRFSPHVTADNDPPIVHRRV